MNIVQQVGTDYFMSRFNGCIFFGPSGNPCVVDVGRATPQNIPCKELINDRLVRAEVPFEYFKTFKFLSVPELGWRARDDGRVLVRLRRKNNSYTRGITLDNMLREYAPHTDYMCRMGKIKKNEWEAPAATADIVTRPGHLSMAEGIDALNNGKIISFTNSAHVAVIPENDSVYRIMYNSTHVANISPDGNISPVNGCEDFDQEILQ